MAEWYDLDSIDTFSKDLILADLQKKPSQIVIDYRFTSSMIDSYLNPWLFIHLITLSSSLTSTYFFFNNLKSLFIL